MKLRHATARMLLALLLVLSQQLGIAHAVSHLASADTVSARGKQLPAERQCEQCLGFAALGSALPTPPQTPAFGAAPDEIVVAAPVAKPLPCALRAFDSRAPPAFL